VVQIWRVTPSTKQIQIMSIPRDTVVSMLPPDTTQFGTYNRINSSFNTGADQLVKTITANFGIQINHVVQVDFAGFQDAVNALGGIYLDFPYPAKDSYSGLDITTPGCQLLNGAQALAVARARHYEYYAHGYWQFDGTSDFGRIQRQDVFLRSLITSAKSKVNPLTVNAFIGSIHEGVTIDDGFGINELIGLALDYRSFDPANLQTQTLPTEAANDFGDLGDVLTAQQPEAQQMLVNIFGSDLTTPTNPPPDAAGYPNPPPTITPTTVAPASPTTTSGGKASSAPTTTTTTAPPSFNPTPCTPS
jgi:LCP family protein required for cell wall assembly